MIEEKVVCQTSLFSTLDFDDEAARDLVTPIPTKSSVRKQKNALTPAAVIIYSRRYDWHSVDQELNLHSMSMKEYPFRTNGDKRKTTVIAARGVSVQI